MTHQSGTQQRVASRQKGGRASWQSEARADTLTLESGYAGADLGPGKRWGLGNAVHSDGVDRQRVIDSLASMSTDKDVTTMGTDDKAIATIIADNARLLRRCKAMLGQALSGSEHGDVRFEFEDGRSSLSGHLAVLCAVSEEYEGMFRSGMVEEKRGVVRVPPGVSESGYRGLLEWVYLGEDLSPSVFTTHPSVLSRQDAD